MYRETKQYPSKPMHTADFAVATRRTSHKHYTGDEIVGIAMLHKQGFSPVRIGDTEAMRTDPKKQ